MTEEQPHDKTTNHTNSHASGSTYPFSFYDDGYTGGSSSVAPVKHPFSSVKESPSKQQVDANKEEAPLFFIDTHHNNEATQGYDPNMYGAYEPYNNESVTGTAYEPSASSNSYEPSTAATTYEPTPYEPSTAYENNSTAYQGTTATYGKAYDYNASTVNASGYSKQEGQSPGIRYTSASDPIAPGDEHVVVPQLRARIESDDGKLFIGGLSWETTDETLFRHYRHYGKIADCIVMKDGTGKSRGFAFVTFEDASVIDRVMQDKHVIDSKLVDPKPAIPKDLQVKSEKMFIGQLPDDLPESELEVYFSAYGRVMDTAIMYDSASGKSRGFAFITYESDACLRRALDAAPHVLRGRTLEVTRARPKDSDAPLPSRSVLRTDARDRSRRARPPLPRSRSYRDSGRRSPPPRRRSIDKRSYPEPSYPQQDYYASNYNTGYSYNAPTGYPGYSAGYPAGYSAPPSASTGYSAPSSASTGYSASAGYSAPDNYNNAPYNGAGYNNSAYNASYNPGYSAPYPNYSSPSAYPATTYAAPSYPTSSSSSSYSQPTYPPQAGQAPYYPPYPAQSQTQAPQQPQQYSQPAEHRPPRQTFRPY